MDSKVEQKLESINSRLNHIDKTVDSHLSSIDKTLALQNKSLDEHIRRTALAEENISLLRDELKPLNTFKDRCEGALKLVGGICLVGGLILGFLKILL